MNYTLEDGTVYRGTTPIAEVDGGEVKMLPGCDNYRMSVGRFLNSLTPAADPDETMKTEELTDREYARRNGLPEPPKKHPRYGDKTKPYAQWLFDYRREKFDRVFKVVGTGEIPIVDPDSLRQTGTKKVLLANRKTHLTHYVPARDTGPDGQEMSWDAETELPMT